MFVFISETEYLRDFNRKVTKKSNEMQILRKKMLLVRHENKIVRHENIHMGRFPYFCQREIEKH